MRNVLELPCEDLSLPCGLVRQPIGTVPLAQPGDIVEVVLEVVDHLRRQARPRRRRLAPRESLLTAKTLAQVLAALGLLLMSSGACVVPHHVCDRLVVAELGVPLGVPETIPELEGLLNSMTLKRSSGVCIYW